MNKKNYSLWEWLFVALMALLLFVPGIPMRVPLILLFLSVIVKFYAKYYLFNDSKKTINY